MAITPLTSNEGDYRGDDQDNDNHYESGLSLLTLILKLVRLKRSILADFFPLLDHRLIGGGGCVDASRRWFLA